jgi:predicted solute-binding protein
MRKKIAVPHHLYAAPLTYGLMRHEPAFDLEYDLPAANALKLRDNIVDGAFVTPIDYARESSDYVIIPEISATSRFESRSIGLYFRTGLPSLTTVAVDIGLTSEIVLARIILAEKYDLHPHFIPMMPDLPTMLAKADAALLTGNSTFALRDEPRKLDLVDEWTDLTELPYVHGFWACTPNSLSADHRRILRDARDEGIRNFDALMQQNSDLGAPENYFGMFSYELDDETLNSLGEFFRFSFYYGVIKDIPEIRIGETEDENPPFSQN